MYKDDIEQIIKGSTISLVAEYVGDDRWKQYEIYKADYSSHKEMSCICNLINDSYDDKHFYGDEDLVHFLTEHDFLLDINTYYIKDKLDYIGTCSIGKYKNDDSVCGCTLICVSPIYQGKNLGKVLISYAQYKMFLGGQTRIENLIKLKRNQSLYAHFGLGFIPKKIEDRIVPLSKKNSVIEYGEYCNIINERLFYLYDDYWKSHNK